MPSGRGLLFVVSAPSGAGKTSLCKWVLKDLNGRFQRPLKWSVSYTTRPPRKGERNAVDYFFVSQRKFQRMIQAGEFAEWAVVHDHHYGTSLKYLKQAEQKGVDLLLEIDCQGARTLRLKYRASAVFIFILPPSLRELRRRLAARGTETRQLIERRLRRAAQEVEEYPIYDYIIINRDFELAAKELAAVILAERSRRDLREPEFKSIVEQIRRK